MIKFELLLTQKELDNLVLAASSNDEKSQRESWKSQTRINLEIKVKAKILEMTQ